MNLWCLNIFQSRTYWFRYTLWVCLENWFLEQPSHREGGEKFKFFCLIFLFNQTLSASSQFSSSSYVKRLFEVQLDGEMELDREKQLLLGMKPAGLGEGSFPFFPVLFWHLLSLFPSSSSFFCYLFPSLKTHNWNNWWSCCGSRDRRSRLSYW